MTLQLSAKFKTHDSSWIDVRQFRNWFSQLDYITNIIKQSLITLYTSLTETFTVGVKRKNRGSLVLGKWAKTVRLTVVRVKSFVRQSKHSPSSYYSLEGETSCLKALVLNYYRALHYV